MNTAHLRRKKKLQKEKNNSTRTICIRYIWKTNYTNSKTMQAEANPKYKIPSQHQHNKDQSSQKIDKHYQDG